MKNSCRSALTKKEFFAALDCYDVKTVTLVGKGNAQYLNESKHSEDNMLIMENYTYFMVYGKLLDGVVIEHRNEQKNRLKQREHGFEVASLVSSQKVWFSPEKSKKWSKRVCEQFAKYKRWIDEYRATKLLDDKAENAK